MKKIVFALITVLLFSFLSFDLLRTKESLAQSLGLPLANEILPLSDDKSSPVLLGLKLNSNSALDIEFYVDSQDKENVSEQDVQRLINYFLAGLTVKNENLWVNLSPYENDRVMDDALSITELGEGLLGQDYVLKQLSASLSNPKTDLGKEFWKHDTAELNKVWISPDKTEVLVQDNYVFIADASLKVESENEGTASDVLLPKITEQVNHGEHFSQLRQIYHSLILAKWFKENHFKSFYKNYIDKNMVCGIDAVSPELKSKVYKLYCQAFEKGVYNFTAKERDASQKLIKRSYFSGGINVTALNPKSSSSISSIHDIALKGNLFAVKGRVDYQAASSSLKSKNFLLKTVLLGAALSLNVFAQDLDPELEQFEQFLENPFGLESAGDTVVVAAPSVEGWDELEEFMLNKFSLPHQQTLIEAIADHSRESDVLLSVSTDHEAWLNLLEQKFLSSTTRAFVNPDGEVYIYLDYARPNVLFHELIHVFQKTDQNVFRRIQNGRNYSASEKHSMISLIPMVATFNEIASDISQSNDEALKRIFSDIVDHLYYDYNNPFKRIWYNQRLGSYSLDSARTMINELTDYSMPSDEVERLLLDNELNIDRGFGNQERAINEFFAFVYGASVAHDLGYGQEVRDTNVINNLRAALSTEVAYRHVNVEPLGAKLLFLLRRHPGILSKLESYYSSELGMPTGLAFNIDPAVQDYYYIGVEDDLHQLLNLADYYTFVGRWPMAFRSYNQLLAILPEADVSSEMRTNMTLTALLQLAGLHALNNDADRARATLERLEQAQVYFYENSNEAIDVERSLMNALAKVDIYININDTALANNKLEVIEDVYFDLRRDLELGTRMNVLSRLIAAHAALGNEERLGSLVRRLRFLVRRLGDVPGQRDMADNMRNIGRNFARHGYVGDAQWIYERSLRYYADTTVVQREIYTQYMSNNDYEGAAKYLENNLFDGSDYNDYLILSELYFHELRNTDMAIEVLQRGLSKYPGNLRLIKAISDLYYFKGERRKSEEFLKLHMSQANGLERLYTNVGQNLNGGIDLKSISVDSNQNFEFNEDKFEKAIDILSLRYEIKSLELQDIAAL